MNKILTIGLVILGVFLLALILQTVIIQGLIIPLLSYLAIVRLQLLSVPQSTYWYMLIAALALILLVNVLTRLRFPTRREQVIGNLEGPVEKTARLVINSRQGVYSRWTLANRLGEIARHMLALRRGVESPLEIRHLEGRDWNPPEEVQAYLEAGLNRSFIHAYSQRRRFFFLRRKPTVYELDPEITIQFLESQMENEE